MDSSQGLSARDWKIFLAGRACFYVHISLRSTYTHTPQHTHAYVLCRRICQNLQSRGNRTLLQNEEQVPIQNSKRYVYFLSSSGVCAYLCLFVCCMCCVLCCVCVLCVFCVCSVCVLCVFCVCMLGVYMVWCVCVLVPIVCTPGQARVEKNGKDLAFLEEEALFGEMSAFIEQNHRSSASILVDSPILEVWVIPVTYVGKIFQSQFGLAERCVSARVRVCVCVCSCVCVCTCVCVSVCTCVYVSCGIIHLFAQTFADSIALFRLS